MVAVGALAGWGLPAVASASAPAGRSVLGAPAYAFGPVAGVRHAMGLPVKQPKAVSAARASGIHAAASALPANVDLTAYAAPVGDQGQVGSCAAWATDYTALGYWQSRQGIAGGGLAPMYAYSQQVYGRNVGTTIDGNLYIAQSQGVDNQAHYWQGNYDYVDTPTSAERANAANWKLASFSDLAVQPSTGSDVTQQSIESALAAGTPVVVGIPVYMNFEYITSANHGFYAGPIGQFLGGHAITALGYDSTGLRIENSWGTWWGDRGYATLSWSFVNRYAFQAVAVGQLVASRPVNTIPPVISGTARQGQTLTANNGTWNPTGTGYGYQWQRAIGANGVWSAISGATGATYPLAASDVGANVRVLVTASKSSGSATATSTAIGPVASGAPLSTAAPTVTGIAGRGVTLTVSSGTWNPAADSYGDQWQHSTNGGSSWSTIIGASGPSYTLAKADETSQIRVIVTGVNTFGQATAATVATLPVKSSPPVNIAAPAVTGLAQRGGTLSATTGSWTGAGDTYAYQWQRNPGNGYLNLTGATGSTYAATQTDERAALRVLVTVTNPDASASQPSQPTAPVAIVLPVNTNAPSIRGALRLSATLTANPGVWIAAGSGFSYDWQRGTPTSGYHDIAGAIRATYTLQSADLGQMVRLIVTTSNVDGSRSATSIATQKLT